MTPVSGLSALEEASGYITGTDSAVPGLPKTSAELTVRKALEAVVREALQHSPCVVSFSGGRDSSAVLALAVGVARREGLPLPVAFTQRYPDAPWTDESAWQTRVVKELGLDDWVRQELTDELDYVGPVASHVLLRHGSLWPPNVHCLVPALDQARGGVLLTGVGGDHLLIPGRHARLAAVLAGRGRPELRDAARLLLAAAPVSLRTARRLREEDAEPCAWLRPRANRAVARALAHEAAEEPVRRQRWVDWTWGLRSTQIGLRSMSLLAADAEAQLVHPFLEPRVLASISRWTRRRGPLNRTDAMHALFGDLLPADVCERRSKAAFDAAFWNRSSRDFALTLAPEEVDSELVDGPRAVELWTQPETEVVGPFRSMTLFQALWLERRRSAAGGVEEGMPGPVHGTPVARTP